jgi:two-component system, OmpR family, phosphate regulon sensor histidine kinase PhoR
LAIAIDSADGKPIGFIRTALPTEAIERQVRAVQRAIWGIVGVVSLCVLALAYWIVGHIVKPVASLTKAADAIASGDYQHRIYIANKDELGNLARTFNRLSQELDGRMKLLGQTGDRQSTVLGGMIEGVIAVDTRQRIVLANNAAAQQFGFRPAAVEGRPLLEVVRNHAIGEAVNAAFATSRAQRLETRSNIQLPAFANQYVDIHVQPLPGKPCPGVVLVMHDTTELRRLESLRRDFIANVSHELKTPLSSIKAYTETLRNGASRDPETSEKFLARIAEQADRLHHLIIDMLTLARIESEQQPFEIDEVDVLEVAMGCIEDHRPAADAKLIELTIDSPASSNESPCRVRVDREALREILNNLIDNAIKYTPRGGKVSISWGASESRSVAQAASPSAATLAFVQIAVRDTGIGIKPDEQRRVFERFYRVDKARSRELGGTGLGLSIVKHLAQSFGGKVSVDSEPGQGSRFIVELPRADCKTQ